ncbi:hypothetical protein [Streptomyces sp. NPDC126514]|uniref:hypothetical protein n=1 Tax=Streptomyces sp. NPDC126514 TaxID=3155210 RepID=UPI00331E0B22
MIHARMAQTLLGAGLTAALAAAVATPAGAAVSSVPEQQPQTVTVTSARELANGATVSIDYTVQGTSVLRHHRISGGLGLDYYAESQLTEAQANKLDRLVSSRAFASERWALLNINCGSGVKTDWTVHAGDITTRTAACNGAWPVLPRTTAEIVKLVASASQS